MKNSNSKFKQLGYINESRSDDDSVFLQIVAWILVIFSFCLIGAGFYTEKARDKREAEPVVSTKVYDLDYIVSVENCSSSKHSHKCDVRTFEALISKQDLKDYPNQYIPTGVKFLVYYEYRKTYYRKFFCLGSVATDTCKHVESFIKEEGEAFPQNPEENIVHKRTEGNYNEQVRGGLSV